MQYTIDWDASGIAQRVALYSVQNGTGVETTYTRLGQLEGMYKKTVDDGRRFKRRKLDFYSLPDKVQDIFECCPDEGLENLI